MMASGTSGAADPVMATGMARDQVSAAKAPVQVCMGLLLGLYAFKHESSNEFKEWGLDAASEWAGEVVSAWEQGRRGRSDIEEIKAFIDYEMADWSGLSI